MKRIIYLKKKKKKKQFISLCFCPDWQLAYQKSVRNTKQTVGRIKHVLQPKN